MNKIKKIFSIVITLTILITSINITTVKADELGSGTLNKEGTVKWSLSKEGILTISGPGMPSSYSSAPEVPWDALRTSIKKVQINSDTAGIKNMSYWFKDCTNLIYVNQFPKNATNLHSTFAGCTSLQEVPMIPEHVNKMISTFSGCTSLKKIPEFELFGVSNMAYTFKKCESLKYAYISLPYPVTNARGLFWGCRNLSAMVIFNGCIQLGKDACSYMFTDAAESDGAGINVFAANMTMDSVKNFVNTGYEKVNFCGEIRVEAGEAYNYDKKAGCSYAYVKDSNTLYVMGNGKFNSSSLMGRFADSGNVRALNIGNGITGIGDEIFKNYNALETVILPNTLKNIGNSAFKGCSSLKNIFLPENLTTIGNEAFDGCIRLSAVYIPENVKNIGDGAFSSMSENFYLECLTGNLTAQKYAEQNGIICRYPKCLYVKYKGNVVEGCRLNNSDFESIALEYSDGTAISVPVEEISVDEYKIVAGENMLTARYGDFKCTFEVTGAERNIVNLEAKYDAEYGSCAVEGGIIDTNAISVLAEYDNGTEQYLKYGGITDGEDTISSPGYYTIDPYNLAISSDGELNQVIIRAKLSGSSSVSKISRISVPAAKKSITGISAFYVGGDIVEGTGLNTENIYAFANFNNGTKERILFSGDYNDYGISTDTNYIVLDDTAWHENEFIISKDYEYSIDAYKIKNSVNRITLWCNNKQASFEVNGIPKSHAGISAVYNGAAIEDGELDMDMLEVSIDYNNGDSEVLEDKSAISLQENYSIVSGDNYIEVGYTDINTGKRYKCNVYVKGIEKTPVKIVGIVPLKPNIVAGEWLKNIEFNVSVLYDNGKVYDSIASWDLEGCVKEGENQISISYRGIKGEAVFQAEKFIPEIVTTLGTEPPEFIEKNNSVMLMVKANSDSAMENKVTDWKSSDENIVRVSQTGMVTAVDYGKAEITATVNGVQAVYCVEVPMPDIKGIEAEYEGSVLEDTEADMQKLRVFLILENEDIVRLSDISGVSLQKDYRIKEGHNEIELYYIDDETAEKYACILQVHGIGKTPVEIIRAESVRDDIIAGEALRTLEFKAEILYNNKKTYEETIKYEGKGFAQEGINNVIVSYKGVYCETEFKAGKFIPYIVLKSGGDVPKEVLTGQNQELMVKSNCDAAMENKTIMWSSSDENVMAVDGEGRVTILGPGTSDITAKVNEESVKCTIRVIVPAEDLKIDANDMTMSKGKSGYISYKVLPDNSTDNISWVSSNTDIATVSDDGMVTTLNVGQCVITAVTESGISKKVNLTVKKEASKISLNYTKTYVIKGKTLKLKYSLPANTFTDRVTWSSSNKKVASVSSTGKVKAKKVGNTIITVKTATGKKCICRVYVRNNPDSILLDKKNITLKKGKSIKLKYVIPQGSYVSKITWISGDKKVATVSASGKIKAVKSGVTYIKVKTNNNKTAKCKIKVV